MNVKKPLGIVCVILCVLLLALVAAGIIAWRAFWLLMILMAGFAYLVLPGMED